MNASHRTNKLRPLCITLFLSIASLHCGSGVPTDESSSSAEVVGSTQQAATLDDAYEKYVPPQIRSVISGAKQIASAYKQVRETIEVAEEVLRWAGFLSKPEDPMVAGFRQMSERIDRAVASTTWQVSALDRENRLGTMLSSVEGARQAMLAGGPRNEGVENASRDAVFQARQPIQFLRYARESDTDGEPFVMPWWSPYDGPLVAPNSPYTQELSSYIYTYLTNTDWKHMMADRPAVDGSGFVYDWRYGVPALAQLIALRLQVIATEDPNFRNDHVFDNELSQHRSALRAEYQRMLDGIRCVVRESPGNVMFGFDPRFEWSTDKPPVTVYTHVPHKVFVTACADIYTGDSDIRATRFRAEGFSANEAFYRDLVDTLVASQRRRLMDHQPLDELYGVIAALDSFRPESGASQFGMQVWSTRDFPGQLALQDITGDGNSDLIGSKNSSLTFARSTGSQFRGQNSWISESWGNWGTDYGRSPIATLFSDTDGDGLGDVIMLNDSTVSVRRGVSQGGTASTHLADEESWWGGLFYGAYGNLTGDVDGDGKADLVGLGDGYVGVLRSTGKSFGDYETWSGETFSGGANSGRKVLLGDVNGDGRADLVALGDDDVRVMFSNGAGFDAPQVGWGGAFFGHVRQALGLKYDSDTMLGDVDGDGRADLVGAGDGYVGVIRSTGTSFGAYETWSAGLSLGTWGRPSLGDVNGDGRQDLVATAPYGILALVAQ